MWLRAVWNTLVPGVCAASGASLAMQLLDDPWLAVFAAGVSAVAGALLQDREALTVTLPSAEREAAPERRPAETKAGGMPGELPLGLGRVLLERMPLGVVLISAAGHVLFINPSARGLFGRSAESGFPVEALRAPRLLEAIERVSRDRGAEDVEFALSRAKTLHLCCHVVSLAAEPRLATGWSVQPDVLVVIEDRTQARRAEELHRDFVANASHELKTPLAAVSGIIETLLGHAKGDAEAQARFLGMMSVQTERMRRLVEDLLSLNRIELNERVHPQEPQPIGRIVWEVAEALRPFADAAGMRIVMPLPQAQGGEDEGVAAMTLALVPGDREQLSQVFVNLIENALKYARPSEEVRILSFPGSNERAGMVGIAVEDDGPGIAREHLPRLTERFYRVSAPRSRDRGGTGLGLAIVKHILNRHRGQLDVESRQGEGTRFTVWLPVLGSVADEDPAKKLSTAPAGEDVFIRL